MYRFFFTFLVTWTFAVVSADTTPPPACNFDKIEYATTLNLTMLTGEWHQIRSSDNLPCSNSSSLLVIDETKKTIKFPAEVNRDESESYVFAEDAGVLKLTIEKLETEVTAVLLPSTLDYTHFILYTCQVVNTTEVLSGRFLSKKKDYKLADAQNIVNTNIASLPGLKWNWTDKYCSSASMAHISYVITIFAAVFLSKM